MNAMISRTLESIPVVPPNPAHPGSGWLAGWDHRDFRELDSDNTAPKTVRELIRERLPAWGLGHLQEAAELVATELTTNSVQATWEFITEPRLPPLRVWLLGSATQVAVAVRDDVAKAPVERVAGEDDESGRGLFFVRKFSNAWTFWFPEAPFTGKVTMAVIG